MNEGTRPNAAWKPLILCPHRDLGAGLTSALSAAGTAAPVLLAAYRDAPEVRGAVLEHQCNIAFVDVATDPEAGAVLLSALSDSLRVVALGLSADADQILRCLRRGALDFLAAPVTADAVRDMLERLSPRESAAPPKTRGFVIAVVPGKPGCGASTLAAHLAPALRRGEQRILLIDFDLMCASVGFLLKVKSDFHVEHAVQDIKRLDQDVWAKLVTRHHGFDVLPAPENASRLDLERSALQQLIAFCRERYDGIVMDTGGAASPLTVPLALLADQVLLVTTNELAALQSTGRTVARLEAAGVARTRWKLLLNRYTPATGLRSDDVATALKLDVFALLANEYDVLQQAALDGHTASPASRYGRSVAEVAARLVSRPDSGPPPKRSWLSLFGARPVGAHA